MRSPIAAMLGLAAVLAFQPVCAQEPYPTRPITLVVPSPAGGTTDLVARILAKRMGELVGQPVIVENRAGANGYIGTQVVLRGPKDGYLVDVMSGSLHSFTPAMVDTMPFDPIDDFALVSRIVSVPYVLVSSSTLPYRTVAELIKSGRDPNSKFAYGSFGVGSSPQLITEWFKLETGVQALHVPYKGGGQAAADIMSGQVTFMFNSLPASVGQIKGNQVRALGVTTATALPLFPDVPPIGDTVKGFEVGGWLGLGVPKGTPTAITDKLRQALQTAVQDPTVAAQLRELGAEPLTDATAGDFRDFLVAEKKKWDTVVRDAHIPKEKE